MGHTDDTRGGEGATDRHRTTAPNNRPSRRRPEITTHTSDEERTVFTEPGNSDAWIATDATVAVER